MKLWIEIDYEIDGEATQKQVIAAAGALINGSVITSEEMDDGEDYAFIVNSFEVLTDPPVHRTASELVRRIA